MKLQLDAIRIGERLRETCFLDVQTIAASMEAEGQLQPILVRTVDGIPHLIAGAHRVEAAKKLGWTEIAAVEIRLPETTDAELIKCAIGIAEVDENLARREMDPAERVIFFDERAQLTARRIARAALMKAEAEHAAAKGHEKKDAAGQKKKRAAKTAAKVSTFSSDASMEAVEKSGRLPNGVLEQVAKETGYTKGTIQQAVSIARQVGRENLRVMSGTSMSARAELKAFIRLKQEAPEEAERCIKLARDAKTRLRKKGGSGPAGFSPSGRLSDIIKAKKTNARAAQIATDRGRLGQLDADLTGLGAKMRSIGPLVRSMSPTARNKLDRFHKLAEDFESFAKLVRDMAKPADQERTGREHFYSDEPSGAQEKELVRKELDAMRPQIDTFREGQKATSGSH